MTETPRTGSDPAIAAYLDDLARMLTADPAMRAEVLGGVSEHIEVALAARPGRTGADVSAVLAELGPPEAVAAAALADGAGSAPPRGLDGAGDVPGGPWAGAGTVPQRPPALDRTWVPPVIGLLLLLAAGVYLLVLGGLATFSVTDSGTVQGAAVIETTSTATGLQGQTESVVAAQDPLLPTSYDAVWMVVVPLPLVALPWLLSTVLLTASSLWTARQKWAGVLLLPGIVVLAAVAVVVVLSVPAGALRVVVLAGVLAVAAFAVVAVVGRLWSSGARCARELAARSVPA